MKPVTSEHKVRYKIGTVTRLCAVSPVALRNWERRYSFLQPERGPGGQRLYTESDLRVLRTVCQLLRAGHSIGEIALRGRAWLLGGTTTRTEDSPEERRPAQGGASADATPLAAFVTELTQAAVELDSRQLQRTLDAAFAELAPRDVLMRVLMPASRRLGELWLQGDCGVASEHLASAAFTSRIQRLVESAASSATLESPIAITACFPDEQHELGVLFIAFELSRRGIRVVHLGPSLPLEDLELAIHRIRPRWTFLSVTRRATYESHKPRLLDMLDRVASRTRFAVGGPAVQAEDEQLIRRGATVCGAAHPEEVISQFVEDDQEG